MNSDLPARRLAIPLAALLLIAGCGKSSPSSPQASTTASGEILPGTVSDSMLTTDRSQAEAPLAPAAHTTAGKTDAEPDAQASASTGNTDEPDAATSSDQVAPKPAVSAKPATP